MHEIWLWLAATVMQGPHGGAETGGEGHSGWGGWQCGGQEEFMGGTWNGKQGRTRSTGSGTELCGIQHHSFIRTISPHIFLRCLPPFPIDYLQCKLWNPNHSANVLFMFPGRSLMGVMACCFGQGKLLSQQQKREKGDGKNGEQSLKQK